jgi:phenylacetate-CoA ligase
MPIKELQAKSLDQQELTHPAEAQLIPASEKILDAGRKNAVDWANQVIAGNPNYRQHLLNQGIQPDQLNNIEGLITLPLIDKKYLRGKSTEQLCPDTEDIYGISGSSGMTGEPVWIPRRKSADAAVFPAVSGIFADNWDTDTRPAATVTAWSLGMWVAGTMMVETGNRLAKESQLIAIHPGSNLNDAVEMIKQISSLNRPIILQAYPPFAAEVLCQLQKQGIDLPTLNLNLFVAGEPMSESWRIHIQKLLGGQQAEKDLSRVISLYGTAEGGVMGFETRLSVLIRKMAHQNLDLRQALFGSTESLPMLFQYPPTSKWIESVDDEVVFSGRTGIPSVRYNMHDRGGTISFKQMMDQLHQQGYNPLQTLTELGYGPKLKNTAPLPFVFVFGRKDGVVSLDGANIYPADLDALLLEPQIQSAGIQEYALGIEEQSDGRLRLVIHLQLQPNGSTDVSPDTAQQLAILASRAIAANNPDYRQSLNDNPEAVLPLIELHSNDDPLFASNRKKFKRTRKVA